MSMTYNPNPPTVAPSNEEVFVPRYARTAKKKNKPVNTWMILAPLGAVVVLGGAAAMFMGGDEAAPAETAPAQAAPVAPRTQTAPAALTAIETPAAPTPAAPAAQPATAPTVQRVEAAPRRAAPVQRQAAPTAPDRAPAAVEPTGPRAYSRAGSSSTAPAAPAIVTQPMTPVPAAPTPAPAAQAPTISVQPLN